MNSELGNQASPQRSTFPESIHSESHQHHTISTDDGGPASIAKRDYNYIGNRMKKEYVEGGIEIYEDAR